MTHDEGDEYERDGEPDEDRAQPGYPPGHALVVPAPAEPEDAYHQNGPADHSGIEALLCGRESVPLLEETGVRTQEPEVDKGREDGADTDSDEDEAVVRDGKVARADEDHRKSLEHCERKKNPPIIRNSRFQLQGQLKNALA